MTKKYKKQFKDIYNPDLFKPVMVEFFIKDGLCHHDHDQPALVINDTEFYYLKEGHLYRKNGPAIKAKKSEKYLQKKFESYSPEDKKLFKTLSHANLKNMTSLSELRSFIGCTNLLHREDGPALLRYDEHENISEEIWCLDGRNHREDGPAVTSSLELKWMQHGKLHRENGPALLQYSSDGFLRKESWMRHDILHRADGPAITRYASSKEIYSKYQYYLNNQRHREDGPALIIYSGDQEKELYYYNHGKLHREDGPAYIYYGDEAKNNDAGWYLEGKEIKINK